jgi:hypothetical protein
VAGFKRVFGATIFFGTDQQQKAAAVLHQSRFNFLREAEIWYARTDRETTAGSFQNSVVLTDEFYREILNQIPAA